MGIVIDLEEHRRARRPAEPGPVERLDAAVSELERLLAAVERHPAGKHLAESELLAITGALSIGRLEEAVERAERLCTRLRKARRRA